MVISNFDKCKSFTHIDVLSEETPLLDEMAWLFVVPVVDCPLPLPLALFATAPVAAALVAAVAPPVPKINRWNISIH